MRLSSLTILFTGVLSCCAQSIDSLQRFAALTNVEWAQVQSGQIVAKTLEPNHERELAVAGVARLQVSRDRFLSCFRDIESFKKAPAVQQVHRIATDAEQRDFAALTLDSQDADALSRCEIGNCSVKVPIRVIQRLARQPVDAAEYSSQVNAIFRQELLAYVNKYLSEGDAALIQYRDKGTPVFLSQQFRALLNSWKELNELAPEFARSLTARHRPMLPYVEEFLYWSKESFGLKPVVSVTDVLIYQLPGRTWIASKQIYANHYFDTSLAITLLVDDPADASGNSIYLAYVNRSRVDLLTGILSGLKRSLVQGRLQRGMHDSLKTTIQKLESCKCEPTR